jgi:hypothetical protein
MDELLKRIENNHKHHPPKTGQRIKAHEYVRKVTRECAEAFVDACPEGRELSIALTKIEEAMMWANAAIARQE